MQPEGWYISVTVNCAGGLLGHDQTHTHAAALDAA